MEMYIFCLWIAIMGAWAAVCALWGACVYLWRKAVKENGTKPGQTVAEMQLYQDILESEVKGALESTANNKASGGDGIPV